MDAKKCRRFISLLGLSAATVIVFITVVPAAGIVFIFDEERECGKRKRR